MHPRRLLRNGVLLLSGGSKVAIARIAKKAALKRGLAFHVSDCSENVPTRCVADKFAVLPTSSSPDWCDSLLGYCERQAIALVIPTRHGDLEQLSSIRERLVALGCAVPLSSNETLQVCINKLDTHAFLTSIASPTPETTRKSELAQSSLRSRFPLFAKPFRGAAAAGARFIHSNHELDLVPEDWILQSTPSGREYTVNLYLTQAGEPICAIAHERIAVESGEVTQARTRRIQPLIDECTRIARKLPGAQGILNIQAFHDADTGDIQIIEINPRIGGGYPLCDAAKGHYIEWLCREYLDETTPLPFHAWTDNLLMMRYREAVFDL